jgi:hypothetical protein
LPPAHARLLAAIREKHVRVMRLLVADGRIAAGSDAFIEAARCGFAEEIAALVVHLGIPDFQGRAFSPLHAGRGSSESAESAEEEWAVSPS